MTPADLVARYIRLFANEHGRAPTLAEMRAAGIFHTTAAPGPSSVERGGVAEHPLQSPAAAPGWQTVGGFEWMHTVGFGHLDDAS